MNQAPALIRIASFVAFVLTLGVGGIAQGQDLSSGFDAPADDPHVELTPLWSATGVVPGETIVMAIRFDIAEGWHVQSHAPRVDWQVPTTVALENLPDGVTYGDIQWPEIHTETMDLGFGKQELDFFVGEAYVYIKVSVPADTKPGEYAFKAVVEYQACDDQNCDTPRAKKFADIGSPAVELPVTLSVVGSGVGIERSLPDAFERYTGEASSSSITFDVFGLVIEIDESSFVLLLLMAMIGGFLLNLTPCVLPLIPIKIMGLSQVAGNRARCALLGGFLAFGVVAFWVALGVAIAFVAGFDSTNQLFQKPWFTIVVGLIIAVMAVGMMGLFTVKLPKAVYFINPSQESMHGSFLFGIMTAVLSTPCTAPFMGAAAAWAATQSAGVTLGVFGAIGAGMALPYLVLAIFPGMAHKMPRTGPASELIKQVMGGLMLAAAAYFLGTGLAGYLVDPPDPPTLAYWWFVAIAVAGSGFWLAYRSVKITKSNGHRAVFGVIGLLIAAAGIYLGAAFTNRGPIEWTYYTPERVAEAQAEGKVVVLEFTAQWCLNCHFLEQTVLFTDAVSERMNREDVAPIKVDITGNNEVGNARLIETGRRSIPLLVVYDPSGNEVFKSDAYTIQQVLDAIAQARGVAAKE